MERARIEDYELIRLTYEIIAGEANKKIDWGNPKQKKYSALISAISGRLVVRECGSYRSQGSFYFTKPSDIWNFVAQVGEQNFIDAVMLVDPVRVLEKVKL